MPQEGQSLRRKPLPIWVVAIAAVLLVVNIKDFVVNFHLGMMRALDVYPLDAPQMVGYDIFRVLIWAFIVWAGYRLLTDTKSN